LLDKAEIGKFVLITGNNEYNTCIEDIVPDRSDLASVYQYIKANAKQNLLVRNYEYLAKEIADSFSIKMNYYKLKKSLEVFEELSLISQKAVDGEYVEIRLSDNSKYKTSLEKSSLYNKLQALKARFAS
jgi:single-stranded-DNA-specific exonuclease